MAFKRTFFVFLISFSCISFDYAITRQPSCPDLQKDGLYRAITITLTYPSFTNARNNSNYTMRRHSSSPNLKNRSILGDATLSKKTIKEAPSTQPTLYAVTAPQKISGKELQKICIQKYKELNNSFVRSNDVSLSLQLRQELLLQLKNEAAQWFTSPYAQSFTRFTAQIDKSLEALEFYKKLHTDFNDSLDYLAKTTSMSVDDTRKWFLWVKKEAQLRFKKAPQTIISTEPFDQLIAKANRHIHILECLKDIDLQTLDLEDVD